MINCIKDFLFIKSFIFLLFCFTFIGGIQNVWGQYCTPTTTNDGNNGDYLENFEISGGLAGFTDTDTSTNGYLNYYDTYSGEQTAGSYLNFDTDTRGNNVRLSIWVDWNKNEVFEETEKIFNEYIPNQNPSFSGIINIPPATANGDYRMRVRSAGGTEYATNQIDPCGNISWGQARDYKIKVSGTAGCLPPLMATASNIGYTGATLNWVKQIGSISSDYTVEWSTDSGFPTGNTSSAVVSTEKHTITGLTPNVTYYYRVKSECGSGWSVTESFITGNYTPLEVSGFNEDVIAEVGTNPDHSTTVAMDNSAYVLPEIGFVDKFGDISSYGMPKNRVMHNGTTGNISPAEVKYILRPYPNLNVLQLGSSHNTKSFILDQPIPVSKLYFAGISTEGSSALSIKLIYEDATEQTFSGINLEDWYGSENHVFESDYRVSQDWGFDPDEKWPKMRQISITSGIDTNRKVKEIEITKNASASYAHLFAVNVQPEWAIITSLTANPVCIGDQVTIHVTGENATKYRWYTEQTGGSQVAETAGDWTFTLGADTTYWAEAVNDTFSPYVYTNSQRVRVDIPTSDVQFTANSGNWDIATNWYTNQIPDITKCVRVPNGKTLTVNVNNAEARNVTVDAGGKLTISGGNSLRVDDYINNQAGVDNFVVKHDGNLIQNNGNTAINTGEITVEKDFVFSADRIEYNYLTTPVVSDRELKSTLYAPNDPPLSLQYYKTSNDYFYETTGLYETGKAYAVQESPGSGITTMTGKMMGVPFNGYLGLSLDTSGNKYNLIGNPYPSDLDIQLLYYNNSSVINPEFYFWDNRNNQIHVQQGSSYSGVQYAIYNAAAGTSDGTGSAAYNTTGLPQRIPNRKVKVGTGFMVQAKNAGPLNFSNILRINDANIGFFGKPTNVNLQDDRYWLTMTSPSEMVTMMAVVYFEGGNDEFAIDDSESMLGSDDLYSFAGNKKLVIQGKSAFRNTDEIPLGYKAFETGTYYISLYDKEGVFADGQNIYIIDRLLNKSANLSQKPYKFLTRAGEYTDRFLIVYKPKNTIGTAADISNQILFAKIDNQIVITSTIDKITDVEIFDLNSRSVYSKPEINSKEHKINAFDFNHQVIVVTVKTDKGEFVTQKFVNN